MFTILERVQERSATDPDLAQTRRFSQLNESDKTLIKKYGLPVANDSDPANILAKIQNATSLEQAKSIHEITSIAFVLDDVLVLEPLLQHSRDWFHISNPDYPITENMIASLNFPSETAKVALIKRYRRDRKSMAQEIAHRQNHPEEPHNLKIESIASRLNPKRLNILNNIFISNSVIGMQMYDENNPTHAFARSLIGQEKIDQFRSLTVEKLGSLPFTNPIRDYAREVLDSQSEGLAQWLATHFFDYRALMALKKAEGATFEYKKEANKTEDSTNNLETPRHILVTDADSAVGFAFARLARLFIGMYLSEDRHAAALDPANKATINKSLYIIHHYFEDYFDQVQSQYPNLDRERLLLYLGQEVYREIFGSTSLDAKLE